MDKYQINVISASTSKKQFIKALRTVGKLPLNKCEKLYNYFNRFSNVTLIAGVSKNTAENIAQVLTEAGARLEIKISSIQYPMICAPEADIIYKWGYFRILSKVA